MKLFDLIRKVFRKEQKSTHNLFFSKLVNQEAPKYSTLTHLSTNIIVKVNGNAIGAIQNINFEESASGLVKGSCNRIRFNQQRIVEAFAGQIHLTPEHKPFDMDVFETIGNNVKRTTVKNCRILYTGCTYSAQDWIIYEYMNFEAESIFTELLFFEFETDKFLPSHV